MANSVFLRSREALVALLDAQGFSDRELARRAGLAHATVGHLISGWRDSCTPATARAVAKALGCDAAVLFMGFSGKARR